jgi:ATP-binding cassette subfamily B protein/subfamily B ATP-binding cassette protein MsbA
MTVLSFSVAPVLAGSVLYFGPRLKRRAKHRREAQSRLTQFVHQTVTTIPLVQAFGTEQRNQDQYGELVDNVVTVAQQGVLVNKSYALVNGLANSAGRAIVLFAGGLEILAGNLTVGSLLVFLAYVKRLQNATAELLKTYGEIKSCEASLDRLFDVLDVDYTVLDAPGAIPLPASDACGGARIRFERVGFEYEIGRPALSEIDFEAAPGETIALVGPTGAGKSTLVSLIPRFFDPTNGRILFNELDLREVTLDSLRGQVAVVLQEPFLLPMTVAANISYGCPGASREQITAAAKAASAHDFISELPMGYDTVIGERGSSLSGGQKQRIAIARALARDAPVVILDEPTSALDAETETSLLDSLECLTEGRTTVVIAHRLSTIRNADRILVLDQGRIVESGSHDQLLARQQLYQQLYQTQFGGVTQEVAS